MEQSPSWEANSYSAGQEIPLLLSNPKVDYCVHKSLPLVSILNQVHPVQTLPTFLSKIHSSIILPSVPKSSEKSHFKTKILYMCFEAFTPVMFQVKVFLVDLKRLVYISPIYTTWPAHLILLDLITLTIFAEAYKLRSSSLFSRSRLLPLPPSWSKYSL